MTTLTKWIILRDGQPIYSSTSKTRFDVQLADYRAAGVVVDWTTELLTLAPYSSSQSPTLAHR
jgi:hypothetical protein